MPISTVGIYSDGLYSQTVSTSPGALGGYRSRAKVVNSFQTVIFSQFISVCLWSKELPEARRPRCEVPHLGCKTKEALFSSLFIYSLKKRNMHFSVLLDEGIWIYSLNSWIATNVQWQHQKRGQLASIGSLNVVLFHCYSFSFCLLTCSFEII